MKLILILALLVVPFITAKTDAGRSEGYVRSMAAPSVSFVTAPTVLPRDTPFANYSPLVSIQYEGLEAKLYTLGSSFGNRSSAT